MLNLKAVIKMCYVCSVLGKRSGYIRRASGADVNAWPSKDYDSAVDIRSLLSSSDLKQPSGQLMDEFGYNQGRQKWPSN